jgi:hypothetical protein
MKKLDFHFKPKDASSTKSFDTSQAGISDSLPESFYVEKHVVLSDFNANFNNFADPQPSLDPAAHHPLSCPNYS